MITFKGMYDSMIRCIISEELKDADFSAALEDVRTRGKLPQGARIVLDFGGRSLSEETICRLLSFFIGMGSIQVVAWITYDAASQELLKRVGLSTSEPPRLAAVKEEPENSGTLLLQRSLRSGQRVEHQGDVILSGHINDGAEIVASGNVTVLGRLRGLVHAGYGGDESVAVVARSMEAIQVRIGSKVGSLERGALWWGRMVIARVEGGTVLIDYWPAIKAESGDETVGNDRIS